MSAHTDRVKPYNLKYRAHESPYPIRTSVCDVNHCQRKKSKPRRSQKGKNNNAREKKQALSGMICDSCFMGENAPKSPRSARHATFLDFVLYLLSLE